MTAAVVDTNVPIVANEAQSAVPEWPLECIQACVERLVALMAEGHVLVDDRGLIVAEYFTHLNLSGQPGVGDAFVKWLHDHEFDSRRCTRVSVTDSHDLAREFQEFPDSASLASVDPSDRKFIAVCCGYVGVAEILQATDSKWWGWREALRDVGVPVAFLCEATIRTLYESARR